MSDITENEIIFEQPLHEHIRVFLRIEYLQQQAHYFLAKDNAHDHKICLMTILELLQLLDRPDLRSRFTQELSRQLLNLEKLQNTPTIDHEKLSNLIHQIEKYVKHMHQNNGKFIQSLRQNEFIKIISQHYAIPGGTCNHSAPGFHLWLNQTHEIRQAQLQNWLKEFKDIFAISELMLRTIRDTTTFMARTANQGFYQMPLDSTVPCQLIRVAVAKQDQVFPTISVGRHGLSLRFLEGNMQTRASKTARSINFKLACCIF